MNLYDTKLSDEEDALYQTINHGSSIHHAGFLTDVDIFALSHDEKFSTYTMITDPEGSVEEAPPVHFGDLREKLGCDYVANIIARPGGSAVAGIGSHRYLINSPPNHDQPQQLTPSSRAQFDLVQLRNDSPWAFVQETSVTLAGAHATDVVRSFCFMDKVSHLFIQIRRVK